MGTWVSRAVWLRKSCNVLVSGIGIASLARGRASRLNARGISNGTCC